MKSKILLSITSIVALLLIFAGIANAEITWKHNGYARACTQHSNCKYAFAETWCADVNGSSSTSVYHYSRARMEHKTIFGSSVKTDSGRCYGTGYSTASSPCADNELTACTYYGR